MITSTARLIPENRLPHRLLCSLFFVEQLVEVAMTNVQGWPDDPFSALIEDSSEKASSADVLKELRSFAVYDPNTGVFTCTRKRSNVAALPGAVLGGPKLVGYLYFSVLNVEYPVHRLAWLWMTGDWPPSEIDHIDGDGFNNTWNNLRLGNRTLQGRNRCKQSNNTSGVTGVCWHAPTGKWMARVVRKYIGLFTSVEEAAAARELYIKTHPELGFTARHGEDQDPMTSRRAVMRTVYRGIKGLKL